MSIIENKVIDGKGLSEKFIREVRDKVITKNELKGLAIILIGNDPSSQLYVKLKNRACENCGIPFHQYCFDKEAKEEDILASIDFLNNDPETAGILIQLPLPEKFDTDKIISAMDYRKDIDGFHPKNRKNMEACNFHVLPPLPLGIVEMVNATGEKIEDKNIVILCNHKLFGDPFKCVWGEKNQIDIITMDDADWKDKVAEADVLIVSIGLPYFIDKDMIKEGSIVIDVGINKLEDGEIVGDVNFADVIDKVGFISPVPGGVGPMTIAMLLKNLLKIQE